MNDNSKPQATQLSSHRSSFGGAALPYPHKLVDALAKIEAEIPTPETLHLVNFIRRSERGICRE